MLRLMILAYLSYQPQMTYSAHPEVCDFLFPYVLGAMSLKLLSSTVPLFSVA